MNNFRTICLVISITAAVLIQGACGARLEVLSQQLAETVVKTNEEDDYAIKFSVSVRNQGAASKFRAKAKLFSPEGQFYREELIAAGEGETENLEFIFTEPTFLGAGFGDGKTTAEFSYEAVN